MQLCRAFERALQWAVALGVAAASIFPGDNAAQTITPDGTLGTVVNNFGDAYTVTGGAVRGTNLFHSFGDFSVPTLGSATFNGPASTANIFSRVTGGAPSSIDGAINTRAAMPNANFFLINPAGVMFGPSASVDVGGAFHASSADHIRLADGFVFSAVPGAGDAILSSAPPQAFGFLEGPTAITSDGRFGTVVETSDDSNYTISGGTYRGRNLFHSFGAFSVPEFGSATFDGLATTENVISRVTGSQPSQIDSVISTRGGASPMVTANFFLINPAGVIFGPGGFLDVGGSVRISTADQVILPNGVLSAAPASNDLHNLSSGAPQAFGFLAGNPAGIQVNGAQLFVDPPDDSGSRVLSLIAGDVTVAGGAVLFAPGGLIQLVAVGAPGNVDLTSSTPNVASFAQLGVVKVSEASIITAGGSEFGFPVPGGSVVIRSGQLVVESGGWVLSDTSEFGAQAVGIDIATRDSLVVASEGLIQTSTSGPDTGSGILIATRTVNLTAGGAIQTLAFGDTGNSGGIDLRIANATLAGGVIKTGAAATRAGDINITASGTVALSGPASEISTGTAASGDISAGNISLAAGDVVLSDRAQIRSGNAGAGTQAGERIVLNVRGALSIRSLAGISSQAFSGNAGVIEIFAARVVMDSGFINASTLGAGGAGTIDVTAGAVSLVNGAQIASSTQLAATNQAGRIRIDADSLAIAGTGPQEGNVGSATFTGDRSSGIFSTSSGSGRAGSILISAASLTVADGGKITVTTGGSGEAGTIVANIGNATISGGGRIDSSTNAGGAGGAITLDGTLVVDGIGSGLFSTASASGSAGAITVTGPALTVANGGTIDSSTTGVGAGGAININASSQIRIVDGGTIRSDSLGSGVTGDITIAAGDRIMMDRGSISTRAATSDGGNIVLTAPNIIRLENSQITTSVESGTGGGGNIFIDPQFVILNDSSITADAFGGPGGSVTIIANNFLSDPGSVVSASSALSTPGSVAIESPDNNVAGSIAQLPRELVDASRLLRGACSARRAGAPSSFLVAGRGGVPADPDGYLPGFITGSQAARAEAPAPGFALAMAGWDCWR